MWRFLLFPLMGALYYVMCGCSSPELEENRREFDVRLNPDSEYIVVLGDVQTYMGNDNYVTYFYHSLDWIRTQYEMGAKIKSVLLVGDVTNLNDTKEWSRFNMGVPMVSDVLPFLICTGNHDYDWVWEKEDFAVIQDRGSCVFNDHVRYDIIESGITHRFEDNAIENYIYPLTIHGERINVIVLEFGPRTEVVAWADSIVRNLPDEKFILMTHEFLLNGKRLGSGCYADWQFGDAKTTHSSPEYIWNNLVDSNNNVVAVLCGHNGFSDVVLSTNSCGRDVPQVLFNLQYQKNGGDGMLELWEFTKDSGDCIVRIYSTVSHDWVEDRATPFVFSYKY